MRTSDRGIVALAMHEGIVPGPYLDSVGVWTYGIGHTSSAGPPVPKAMPRGMPDDLDSELVWVFEVFRKDLEKFEEGVRRAIKVPIKQHEFDAAVSFHFNTGAIARASWVKKLNAGDRKGAVKAIMNWRKPPEITERRRDEQMLFQTGQYPEGPVTIWRVGMDGRVIWKPVQTMTSGEVLKLLRPQAKAPAQAPPSGLLQALSTLITNLFKHFGARK